MSALTDAEVKIAAAAVMEEWKAIAAETGAQVTFPVSPTNWRVIRAGWAAIERARAALLRRVHHPGRGGNYTVVGTGSVQLSRPETAPGGVTADGHAILREGDELVAYVGDDQKLWLRFPKEFEDGRFVDTDQPPPSPEPSDEPTEAEVRAAAEIMWNDRDARMGGLFSERDPNEIVIVQTMATARAALIAARSVAGGR